MRWPLWILVLVASSHTVASAHPPASLVMGADGAVYYSDLSHVWKLDSDGTKHIAVQDVHTHELWLDADGNLYGEDVTNVGEQYRHRVWRLAADGMLTDVLPWREGHPTDFYDYGFARDQQGRQYVLRRNPNRIDIWDAGERIQSVELDEGVPSWLIASTSGLTHFTLGADLWRWNPQDASPTRIADNLIERTDAFDFLRDRHALMGLWSDVEGAVYVSVFSGQVVKRIEPDGTVSIAARSTGEWSPVSGLVAPDGALWIQEFSTSNDTRIRRLAADGTETLFSGVLESIPSQRPPSEPAGSMKTELVLAGILAVLTALAAVALVRSRLNTVA